MEQNNSVMTEVTTLIRSWEEEQNQQNYDPVPTLTRYGSTESLIKCHLVIVTFTG